jgi:hypothetical protein
MEKQSHNTGGLLIIIALIGVGIYYFVNNPTSPASKTKIEATTLQVTKFYNGEWGYSVSVPEANTSTCIWTWVAGSGSIPDSRTTTINSNATQKHIVMFGDYIDAQWDYKVICIDDFGSQYVGKFPLK